MCSCLDADNAQFLGPSTCSRYQRLSPRRNLFEIAYRSMNRNRTPKGFARPDESEEDEEQVTIYRVACRSNNESDVEKPITDDVFSFHPWHLPSSPVTRRRRNYVFTATTTLATT